MTPYLAKLRAEWERRQAQLDHSAQDRLRARVDDVREALVVSAEALAREAARVLQPLATFAERFGELERKALSLAVGRGVRPERRCLAEHTSGARCRLSDAPHDDHRSWSRTRATITWSAQRAA